MENRILTALGTVVLITTIFSEKRKINNLADVELARRSCDCDGVIVGAGACHTYHESKEPAVVEEASYPQQHNFGLRNCGPYRGQEENYLDSRKR